MLRRLTVAALLAVLAALAPAVARANGDLASDVLLTDTLYASTQPPPDDTVRRLRGVIDEARRAGQPVRVALIASQQDLGRVANFWGNPSEYASYLGQQVGNPAEPGARGNREALVVVMPSGYGTANAPPRAERALRAIELPADAGAEELAAAAGYGVQELAKAAGKPIAATFDKPDAGGGGAIGPILVVLALVVVIAVLVVIRVRSGVERGTQR